MKADHLSFTRATSVSTIGLAIQVAMTLVLLLYGLYAQDRAAGSAAFIAMVGIVVWFVLLLLFDQHRRERLEALEAEAMAEEASTSVFEEGAADLRIASRRLQTWYRIIIPVMSLFVAACLIGLGWWGVQTELDYIEPGSLAPAKHGGWALAFGLVIAFVGFVFARFVSGMAKQAVWANLRAGAAYSVATALLGLALSVSHFVDTAGSDVARRVMTAAVPILTIAMGVEVLLNFMLDLYRPRKKGTYPRPAFDSRVLGLLSAPDRIARSIGEALDYQFGFSVRDTWFYRLMLRWWPAMFFGGGLIIWSLSAVTLLGPDQRGIVLRFGEVVREDIGPGLHFKAPWPIDKVSVPELTERQTDGGYQITGRTAKGVRTVQLGTPAATKDGTPILWTNDHTQGEIFNIVQPPVVTGGESNTQDVALVALEVPVKYAVSNPLLFDEFGPPGVREDILRVIGERALTEHLSSVSIDRVLGADRASLAPEIRDVVQRAFDTLNVDQNGVARGAGVEVLSVNVSRVHPPKEVAPKFEDVVIAEQNRNAMVESALSDQVELLAGVAGSVESAGEIVGALDVLDDLRAAGAGEDEQARQEAVVIELMSKAYGEAATTLATARAGRWDLHMGAQSDAIRYDGMVESYLAAPSLFHAQMYFDTVREALIDSRIYIVGSHEADLHMRLDVGTQKVGLDAFTIDGDE